MLFAFVLTCALAARADAVAAHTTLFLDTEAGCNYEEALVTPHAAGVPSGAQVKLVVTDPVTGASVRDVEPSSTEKLSFPDRTAGLLCAVDGYVLSGAVTNAAAHDLLLMGRLHDAIDPSTGNWNDHWLYETAETYVERSGTGEWSGSEYVTVTNNLLSIDTGGLTGAGVVACTVGAVPTPRRGCVVAVEVSFGEPAVELLDPHDQRFGLTVGYPDGNEDGEASFLYVTNGAWCATPRSVCDPLAATNWQVRVAVDCDEQRATYYVRPAGTNAWTILGTATGIGTDAPTELLFRGTGSIKSLEGHGFDTQLVHVDVLFDGDKNLYPGCNFEQTVVTGRVVSSVIHDTDRTGGTCKVRLVDLDGNEIAVKDYAFTASGTIEFYLSATDLVAGSAYRAIVDLGETEAQLGSEEGEAEAVMGRLLTNANWAVSDKWVYENARTFAGAERGSGVWTGRECASTNGEWICVRPDLEAACEAGLKGITFLATNATDESFQTLVSSVRIAFSEPYVDFDETNGIFGVTVTTTDSGPAFACLSNRVWQAVPPSVAQPEFGVAYEFSCYLQKDASRLHYAVRLPTGRLVGLMTVAVEANLLKGICYEYDAIGTIDIADLTGEPYSTELLRVKTEFDDDALDPGMNFEQTTVSGHVTFETLWETDRTNGTLRVVVRDRSGNIVDEESFEYSGIDEAQSFSFLTDNLVAGEVYSAEIASDTRGVLSDETAATDVMGRLLTNANWAVSDKWVYENARTFVGAERGSGVWTGGECASTNGEWICVRSNEETEGESSGQGLAFQPTNALDEAYSTLVASIRAVFTEEISGFDETNQLFGVTVTSDSGVPVFACLSNHVWRTVPRSVLQPAFGEAYELLFYFQKTAAQMSYFAKDPDGRLVLLLTVELSDETVAQIPTLCLSVLGHGDITDLTGMPYSTDLLRVRTEFDDDALDPGMNFEQTTVSGHVTFETLWETDRTNGTLRVVVRDRNGNIVDGGSFSYSGIDEAQSFEFVTTNLVAGEAYSAGIVAETTGVASDETTTSDVMGRLLTNANWAVSDKWVYENARTFVGAERGSGIWTGRGCASTNGEWICVKVRSEGSSSDTMGLVFQPTNALDETCSALVTSIRAVFSAACNDPGDPDGASFGVSVMQKNGELFFVCLVSDVWQVVPRAVAVPQLGVEYEFYVYTRKDEGVMGYLVRMPDGKTLALLSASYDTDRFPVLSEVDVRGVGQVTDLTGQPYSTDLIRITTDFDASALYPGMNFEESTASGSVRFEKLWETDRTNGTLNVVVRDQRGEIVDVQTFEFTGVDDARRFEVFLMDLNPGEGYSVEISSDLKGVTADDKTVSEIMGRLLTNSTWAVSNLWVYENAWTFAGAERGSGVWTGWENASTNGEWICLGFDAGESGIVASQVSFQPTNELGETYSSLVLGFRASFEDVTTDLTVTNDAFAVTVVSLDGQPAFACLSNRVWQVVPRTVAAPVLDVEYAFTFLIQIDERKMDYLVKMPSGRSIVLLSVETESGLFSELNRVNGLGVGKFTDLTGVPYSTDLVRITTAFDGETLVPGTNFEEAVVSGDVSFEKLWKTDRTNGVLRVVVRDRSGLVIDERYFTFRGIDEKLRFEFFIQNLQPGETYSAEVVADIPNVDVDGSSEEGLMARVVTNDAWAASDRWVRENAHTFAGEAPGTGSWTTNGVRAVVRNGCISIDTSAAEGYVPARFTATNALPNHTGLEYRMRLFFDSPCYGFPGCGGPFGVTVLADVENWSEPLRFAVLTNGVWTTVDSDVYGPSTGVEYELILHVDLRERTAYYAVRSDDDLRATTLMEFPLEDWVAVDLYKTDFHGVGRMLSHEGDGFDVRVVEVEPDFDETFLVPGTNFTETAVRGTLNIRRLWPTDRTSGSCTIVIRDARGNPVALETLTYDQLTNQSFNVFVDNLRAGEAYDIEVVSEAGGETVSSDSFTTVMGRKYGSWICEDAGTFASVKPGTGEWFVTNGSARVEGGDILVDADLDQASLRFHPTNDSLAVRSSLLREVRFNVNFSDAGWLASSTPPELPANVFAAVTVWRDDTDLTKTEPDAALAVLGTNRTWQVLEDTRRMFSATNACTVTMFFDLTNGFVRYTFASEAYTNRVYQFDIDPEGRTDIGFSFGGKGRIRTLDGDVWDAHLIRSSTDEFYDLDSAIRATEGGDDVLSPLWWARQQVTVPRGTFRVFNTNDWLTVVFPYWYYVVKTTDGTVTVYKFNSSNNWIDYAEDGESNVVIDGERSLFFVKTPEGLSWIAALATNEWVSGRIELATNIDLTAHNWTPIAGFSGDFDGCGWRIDGLNNTNRWAGVPGGEYLFGPTNGWGRSTYGLFGTATNASLANVTFAGVAISNLADSVGALAGALAGNCTVSNVTVESGSILGVGGTVAGLAGFADFTDSLTFVNNTNAALIAADSDFYGEGRAAAGILCIAGPTNAAAPLGTVVVTNNVNTGVISNTLYDADLFGGNVAQILAGTTPGARFGEVHLTNNVAAGSVDAFLVRSEVRGWSGPGYPAVNLASAFCGLDADGVFLRALDANEPGSIAVDPALRTARMLSDIFANGTTSHVGRVNDALTALPAGSSYTLPEGLNEWCPVRIDRDVTLDMNGKTVFMIYTNNAFEISAGVVATVRNGLIVVGSESEAFGGDTTGLSTNSVTVEKMMDSDFYDRTTFLIDGEHTSLADLDVTALNGAGTVIQLFDETSVSIDAEKGVLQLNGVTFMTLSEAYSFKTLKDDDGNVIGYRVILADTAENMPRMTMSVGSGQVCVGVTNTRKGMTYKLQKKDSIVATKWTDVGEGVPVTEDNTPVELKDESPSGAQGFYRVLATETAGE